VSYGTASATIVATSPAIGPPAQHSPVLKQRRGN
jgi:hypothetical protein